MSTAPPTNPTMGKKGIVGFVNLGNTCYLNTTLQCLLHTMPLTYFFILDKHTEVLRKDRPQHVVTMQWAHVLGVAWKDERTEAISPKNFVRFISEVSGALKRQNKLTTEFRVGQQHDMVEFLQFMLDCFHESMETKIDVAICGEPQNRVDQLMIESYKHFRQHYASKYSVVIDMLSGQYFTQVVTRDSVGPAEHAESFDPFTVLTLELPKAAKRCTLYECFDLMVRPEIIKGWKGVRCAAPRVIEKKTFLWKLPSIFVIHLKRFVNMYVKNTCEVEVPEELDVSNYCMSYDNENARYRLYAVANHVGNLHFGHYYADCRSLRHGWHRFDDQRVSTIHASDLNRSHAYCLFYYRLPNDRPE